MPGNPPSPGAPGKPGNPRSPVRPTEPGAPVIIDIIQHFFVTKISSYLESLGLEVLVHLFLLLKPNIDQTRINL